MKRNCFIIICISLFLFISQSNLFASETIFYEDFTNNDNNWPIEDDEYAKMCIINDTFIFEHKMDKSGYHVYYPLYIDTEKDFEIEITLYQISGHDDRGYGLIWGMVDDANYFAFDITDNGYYRISKAVDGEWIDIIGWTASDYINTYGGKNTLLLKKIEDLYSFYINGKYVNSLDYQSLGGNCIGFDIWLKQKIAVDSLAVRYIDKKKIILNEDFTDNSLKWYEGSNDEVYAEIKNGYYYFQHKKEDGSYFVWNYVELIPERGFEISTTITHTNGVNDYGYGLVWGMKDLDNLYCFTISDNGYYRYGKYVNDEWTNMIDWTESDLLRSYNGTNTLAVEKNYDMYNFYINDEWIDSYTFESLFGNNIGFVIFKNQTIMIDNLIVKQEMEETSSIVDQAAVLLKDITVEYPGYNETYRTIADAYWEEAQAATDMEDNYEHAMLYLKSAKAEILSDDPGFNELADALSNAGYLLNTADESYVERMDFYEQAFRYYDIVIQIDEALGNEDHLVNDYINIGATYNNRGYYDKAIEYYTKALNLSKEMGNSEGIFAAYDNLGLTSENDEKYYTAIDYYALGIEYARKINNKDEEEFFYFATAGVYDYDLEKWETAIEYYNKALQIAREQEAMADVKNYLYYIGDCYYYLYEDDLADAYYEEADAIIIDE